MPNLNIGYASDVDRISNTLLRSENWLTREDAYLIVLKHKFYPQDVKKWYFNVLLEEKDIDFFTQLYINGSRLLANHSSHPNLFLMTKSLF